MDMKQVIENFKISKFDEASLDFFKYLNVPLNRLIEDSIDINNLLEENKAFDIVDTTYMIGGIDDNIFQGKEIQIELKPQRYEGLLVFAINLNITNPTRTQLSTISRIFNRKFEYTPVVILFKYDDKLSLSNTQRQEYKQNWRDGEKVGKVSILRDIEITNPHRGHIDILENMQINTKKLNQVNSYEELYSYWQEVFDVSILNKSFYKELSDWYFWTLKENNVNFPNAPKGLEKNAHILRHEHNAKNVIRLLTRLLFVWFMKEKKLIPDELFEEKYIKDNLLKEFEPKKAEGLFADSDRSSKYYKAVLQNLFFATLNQEMGKREFRNDKQHRNITSLMRYKNYFTNPNTFIELVEKVVPFMNGGLFECLDKPHPTLKGRQGGEVIVYEDGFSDRPDNELIVPDYIFFGLEEHVDLSSEYGTKGKAHKDTKIKGLISILNSYKFTVAENTPIEEDVALDPELLGKVFENLLASYNPETKTTARKQTGSFYTPREIVSYMVDESLIAYLKTKLEDYEDKEELDKKLNKLLTYDDSQPFEDKKIILQIIHAIDTVKILDPAVGSGAFPMGTLQKMVHLLHKLDPNNEYWQDIQLEKANKETNEVFKQASKGEIKQKVDEILEAFDENINHPDYARKLYLIENSIFGVDIQPIAIQISKLRFFISLVVEQNVNNDKPNFGIRPLPNLESKFVTANTLIGINKKVDNLFEFDDTIKELESKLKTVRHKIFNTKVPKRKRELKEEDKELREQIATELIKAGFETSTAKMLSDWDPYDQNASSPFFDMGWMFGIEDGFNIVIGNPPYVNIANIVDIQLRNYLKSNFTVAKNKSDLYSFFIEKSNQMLKNKGILYFIISNSWMGTNSFTELRKYLLENTKVLELVQCHNNVFDAAVTPVIIGIKKEKTSNTSIKISKLINNDFILEDFILDYNIINQYESKPFSFIKLLHFPVNTCKLGEFCHFTLGIKTSNDKRFISDSPFEKDSYKLLRGKDISRYKVDFKNKFILYRPDLMMEKKGAGPRDINNFLVSKKILIKDVATKIEATIDKHQYLNNDTINVIYKTEKYSFEFLIGLLNSKLINYWYKSIYSTGLHIKLNELREIPISDKSSFSYTTIGFLAQSLLDIDNELIFNYFQLIIDGMVFELYFEEHMIEKQINVIEFIQNDITLIIQDKDFDTLNNEQKMEIIQQLYDLWTHPDNKVRNRLKLFAVRSPNILRPILES